MIATEGIGRILNGIMKYQMSLKGELVPIFREILDKPSPKSLSLSKVFNLEFFFLYKYLYFSTYMH